MNDKIQTIKPAGVMPNWVIEPFLHYTAEGIYNPLTDLTLPREGEEWRVVMALAENEIPLTSAGFIRTLTSHGWIVPADTDFASRYHLKAVTLEGNDHCNQRCNFCPVSIDPKAHHTMSLPYYEDLVRRLLPYKHTIQGVFMINYNEPTVDKYFLDRLRILHKYDMPICLNTNGTGLTKQKIDAIREMGRLRYLSINLSTLDEKEYVEERQYSRLDLVKRNVTYANQFALAEEMAIAVLGDNDDRHRRNFENIERSFGDGHFEVKSFRITNRAGRLDRGSKNDGPIQQLRGCELVGSRPIQHLHINTKGVCYICCQDYYEEYIVGDLNRQSIEEVLTGEAIRKIRAMTYGLEDAPEDYICRNCVFALTCSK